MVGKATKFAVPLNTSVPKETYDRAQKLQQRWDELCLRKFEKRFRMSDLATYVWDIGLTIFEELNEAKTIEIMVADKVPEDMIKFEVAKAKHQFKAPKTLSSMTDEQIEEALDEQGKQSEGEE